jgi:addiction module HigA family antidote
MNEPKNTYFPDYLVAPGEVLEDYLEGLSMSQAELAERTGLSKKTINEIIKAKTSITSETALKLERTVGMSADFWCNLEQHYQSEKVRLAEKERMVSYLQWLKNFPVAKMVKLGWLPALKDKMAQLEALLCFFKVASPAEWETIWVKNLQVSFRQTEGIKKSVESISAWLRQGEIEAQTIMSSSAGKTFSYDNKRFQEILKEIRSLTLAAPDVFIPKLTELCKSAGVALVLVPELPNMGIYGATRWISATPVVQLSLYHKTNDHFWFTFFHEAGHILKHGKREMFLEGVDMECDKETEANSFAGDTLIPPRELRRFLQNGRPSLYDIEQFAKRIGIVPGIVVGRLQKEKIIAWQMGNHLKTSYRWIDDAEK